MATTSSTAATANEYVLDAHALIWFLEGNPRLGTDAANAMRDPGNVLYLPVIALAEACWVVEKGRSSVPSTAALLADVDADPRITLVPLDRQILELSLTLAAIGEMHDRQIAATAIHLGRLGMKVPLISRDPNITASGLVPMVW